MTPDSLTKLLTANDPLALGRSAHTLRHLAEQLAYEAGQQDAATTGRAIPAQAYADALLDHAFGADPLGYKDINSAANNSRVSRPTTPGSDSVAHLASPRPAPRPCSAPSGNG